MFVEWSTFVMKIKPGGISFLRNNFNYMTDNYQILIRKLDEFIRKYYYNALLRGTLLFLAILFISYLLFILLEYFWHFGTVTRTVFFYLFIFLNGSSFLFFIMDPLLKIRKFGKIISHEQAARIIGKHFAEIQDKLLNTLQLKHLENSGEENIELLKAGIDQKIIRLRPCSSLGKALSRARSRLKNSSRR